MADGVRSHDPLNGPVNTQVAVLASALRRRAPELAGQLAGRIIKQIDFYAEGGPVPREDLYESCRDNIEFMFGHLGDLGPRDLSAPRRTGRRRAEQGASIAAVLSSFRIGFAFIWDCVVTEARQSETLSDAELVQIASDVWALHEAFTMEMMTAYRDELTKQALQRDRERSALVEALLEGPLADTATVWDAADLLGLPYQGLFAVVAAETTALARQPLPNIENRLRARDIGSAWRLPRRRPTGSRSECWVRCCRFPRTSVRCCWTRWEPISRPGVRRSRPGNGCTATPTRCATACTASSVRPAACCKTPDRAGSYSSLWRRCARCPGR